MHPAPKVMQFTLLNQIINKQKNRSSTYGSILSSILSKATCVIFICCCLSIFFFLRRITQPDRSFHSIPLFFSRMIILGLCVRDFPNLWEPNVETTEQQKSEPNIKLWMILHLIKKACWVRIRRTLLGMKLSCFLMLFAKALKFLSVCVCVHAALQTWALFH